MTSDASDPYEPSAEEINQMRSATQVEREQVDSMILALALPRWQKVALIVGQLLDEFDAKYQHLPYCFIQARIDALEDQGRLEVAGDPWAMRYSEVRLPSANSEASQETPSR